MLIISSLKELNFWWVLPSRKWTVGLIRVLQIAWSNLERTENLWGLKELRFWSCSCSGPSKHHRGDLASPCSLVCLQKHVWIQQWEGNSDSVWIMFCWWLQTTLQWTIALQGQQTKHFLVSLFSFHISESWKGSYCRADAAESLPIRADMMLISLMLLGKLFSTFVSPIICAKGTVAFLWVSQWISGSRRLPGASQCVYVTTGFRKTRFLLLGYLACEALWSIAKWSFVYNLSGKSQWNCSQNTNVFTYVFNQEKKMNVELCKQSSWINDVFIPHFLCF